MSQERFTTYEWFSLVNDIRHVDAQLAEEMQQKWTESDRDGYEQVRADARKFFIHYHQTIIAMAVAEAESEEYQIYNSGGYVESAGW